MATMAASPNGRVANGRKGLLFWKKASVYFSEFTSNTSLHGFRYIGDRQRTTFERTLWLVLILTSMITCICLLTNTYIKWMHTPIILVADKEGKPISSIPFPAVTICPENKVNQSVYNLTESNMQLRDFQILEERFGLSMLLCDDFAGEPMIQDHPNATTQDIDPKEFIHNISSNVDGLINCRWASSYQDCDGIFTKVFTEDGVCYTFNGLTGDQIFTDDVILFRDFWQHNSSNIGWSLLGGYKNPKQKDAYPRRMFSSGRGSGFSLFLATKEEHLDHLCRYLPAAYKIILHHPGELPRAEKFTSIAMTSVMVEPGTDVSIAVVPKVITISESLRSYKPKKRGCFYRNERKLRYFKSYTQQKCEYECIQNVTFQYCECFAYYMPMVNETPICRSSHLQCTQFIKEEILIGGDDVLNECNCLPTCSSINYSAEVSTHTYDIIRRLQAAGVNVSSASNLKISRVTIFFKESQYFANERSELFGFTDFISDCGGLFGLFVGFSLISLVEAIYFVTIRIIVNCRQYGKDGWYGSSELVNVEIESSQENIPNKE